MENLSRFCRVLVLTRTVWDEPPRLRHQLTQLLLAAGYRVAFAQKPGSIFAPSARVLAPPSGTPCLSLLSPRELLYHQLRLVPWLHHFNAYFARRDLRKTISCAGIPRLTQKDLIINFNYDAFWLRSLFPDRPIITIINDDFEALSRFPFHHHLTWALKRTCAMSNRVLTVSEPLRQRLAPAIARAQGVAVLGLHQRANGCFRVAGLLAGIGMHRPAFAFRGAVIR